MKISNITIGIPAYNEADNLKRLIPLILKQRGVSIKKIIISLDGLEDNSVEILDSISSKKIKVIKNKQRKGIARGINQIFSNSQSEYLVLLDADISIKDPNYLSKLLLPLTTKEADLVSSKIKENQPASYLQEILFFSMRLKENLFSSVNSGHNLYTCYGPARAFTKRVYKKINVPTSIGNDMYIYFFAKKNKYKFHCVQNAITFYNLPKNLKDHLSQSTRFFNSTELLSNYFSRSLVNEELKIPPKSFLEATIKSVPLIALNPGKTACYLLVCIYAKILSMFTETPGTWSIATSTK